MLTDDTLREGMQTPGFAMSYDEKIELAKLISSAGIKRALVAYPPAHKSEFDVTAAIVDRKYFQQVFGLGRTVKEDIDMINATGANISLHLPFKLDNLVNAKHIYIHKANFNKFSQCTRIFYVFIYRIHIIKFKRHSTYSIEFLGVQRPLKFFCVHVVIDSYKSLLCI